MKTRTNPHIGMPVVFSDGWRGKITYEGGGIVACLADGAKPNLHWCGDAYRLTGPSKVKVEGKTATARWGSTLTAEQRRARAKIVDGMLTRARLQDQWADRPYEG